MQEDGVDEINGVDEIDGVDEIMNSLGYDPTKDLNKELDSKIHLYIKKRTKKKSLTFITVSELVNREINIKKFINDMKTKLCCSGTIVKNNSNIDMIQFQGDHRDILSTYLQDNYKVKKSDVIKHGF